MRLRERTSPHRHLSHLADRVAAQLADLDRQEVLVVAPEVAADDRHGEPGEEDAAHAAERRDSAPDGRLRHDVAVADGVHGHERPVHGRRHVGERVGLPQLGVVDRDAEDDGHDTEQVEQEGDLGRARLQSQHEHRDAFVVAAHLDEAHEAEHDEERDDEKDGVPDRVMRVVGRVGERVRQHEQEPLRHKHQQLDDVDECLEEVHFGRRDLPAHGELAGEEDHEERLDAVDDGMRVRLFELPQLLVVGRRVPPRYLDGHAERVRVDDDHRPDRRHDEQPQEVVVVLETKQSQLRSVRLRSVPYMEHRHTPRYRGGVRHDRNTAVDIGNVLNSRKMAPIETCALNMLTNLLYFRDP